MFDIGVLLQLLATQFPILVGVFVVLGFLVVAGQALVLISPTKKDDAFLERLRAIPFVGPLFTALQAFAPIQPKDPK